MRARTRPTRARASRATTASRAPSRRARSNAVRGARRYRRPSTSTICPRRSTSSWATALPVAAASRRPTTSSWPTVARASGARSSAPWTAAAAGAPGIGRPRTHTRSARPRGRLRAAVDVVVTEADGGAAVGPLGRSPGPRGRARCSSTATPTSRGRARRAARARVGGRPRSVPSRASRPSTRWSRTCATFLARVDRQASRRDLPNMRATLPQTPARVRRGSAT